MIEIKPNEIDEVILKTDALTENIETAPPCTESGAETSIEEPSNMHRLSNAFSS